MALSFGRIGLAFAKGAAEGVSESLERREARIEKEVERRDKLFQQAMRYAEQDKLKYEARRQDKSEMLSLALNDVRTMGIGDNSQEQLAIAAALVKETGSKEALQNRLNKMQGAFKINPEAVRSGYTPLVSSLDPEIVQNLTFDSLTAGLVSPAQRQRGVPYQPTEFEDRGLFKGREAKRLTAQQQQFDEMSKVFGIAGDGVTEVPQMGALPSFGDVVEPQSFTKIFESAAAMEAEAIKNNDSVLLKKAEDEYARAAALRARQDKPEEGRVVASISQIGAAINSSVSNPDILIKSDPAMKAILGTPEAKEQVKALLGSVAKKETIYGSMATVLSSDDPSAPIDKVKSFQNISAAARTNVTQNKELVTALQYRGNSPENLTEFLGSLRAIDINSEKFQSYPPETRTVARALQNWNKLDPRRKQTASTAMRTLLNKGFFLEGNALAAVNTNLLYDTYKATPKQSTNIVPTPPEESSKVVAPPAKKDEKVKMRDQTETPILKQSSSRLSNLVKRAKERQQEQLKNDIVSLKKEIDRYPKWMRTRRNKETELEKLEQQLKALED